MVALRLLMDYESYSKIRLGENPILSPADRTLLDQHQLADNAILMRLSINRNVKLSDYLYQTTIHPTFFVDTVHLIASKTTTDIEGNVLIVRLWKLGYKAIEGALQRGSINSADLNDGDFAAFRERPAPERLWILEKLGVLVMLPDKTFAPRQLDLLTPRPPRT